MGRSDHAGPTGTGVDCGAGGDRLVDLEEAVLSVDRMSVDVAALSPEQGNSAKMAR